MAKTLRSRIAAVAVAALGMGLLQAAPANAAGTVSVQTLGAYRADTNIKMYAQTSSDAFGAVKARTDVTADTTNRALATVVDGTFANGRWTLDVSNAGALDAGTYKFTVWADANGDDKVGASEAQTTATITVGGEPVYAVVTPAKSTKLYIGAADAVITVKLYDADDVLTLADDADGGDWTVTESAGKFTGDSFKFFDESDDEASGLDETTGTYSDEWTQDTAGATNLEVKLDGTAVKLNSATSTTTTQSVTVVAPGSADKMYIVSTTGIVGTAPATDTGVLTFPDADAGDDTVSESYYADPSTEGTVYFRLKGTAGAKVLFEVVSSTAKLASRVSVLTIGNDGYVTTSVTVPTPAAATTTLDADTYDVQVTKADGGANTDTLKFTVTYADPEPKITVKAPSSTTNAKLLKGSKVETKIKVTDIYGRILANQAVTVAVSGRNTLAATITTDATGYATYSYTDAGTTATATADTIDFTATNADGTATNSAGITYISTAIAVGSVAVTAETGPFTVDVVQSDDDYNYANDAADAVIKAVVRTATGAPVGAGVLVTFKGASADDLFVDGVATGITDAYGEASVTVYRNKIGTTTFTATANGVSGTSLPVKWEAGAVTTARTVTVTADPAAASSEGIIRITAIVTDRWGNPLEGVEVTVAEDGTGRLYAGQDEKKDTNSSGKAYWDLTSLKGETGTNTVTVTVTEAGTQILDLAGYVGTAKVTGVAAGVRQASTKVEFKAATPTADPTVTALTTSVQAMMTAIQVMMTSLSASITKLLTAIAKKK